MVHYMSLLFLPHGSISLPGDPMTIGQLLWWFHGSICSGTQNASVPDDTISLCQYHALCEHYSVIDSDETVSSNRRTQNAIRLDDTLSICHYRSAISCSVRPLKCNRQYHLSITLGRIAYYVIEPLVNVHISFY